MKKSISTLSALAALALLAACGETKTVAHRPLQHLRLPLRLLLRALLLLRLNRLLVLQLPR